MAPVPHSNTDLDKLGCKPRETRRWWLRKPRYWAGVKENDIQSRKRNLRRSGIEVFKSLHWLCWKGIRWTLCDSRVNLGLLGEAGGGRWYQLSPFLRIQTQLSSLSTSIHCAGARLRTHRQHVTPRSPWCQGCVAVLPAFRIKPRQVTEVLPLCSKTRSQEHECEQTCMVTCLSLDCPRGMGKDSGVWVSVTRHPFRLVCLTWAVPWKADYSLKEVMIISGRN